MEEYLITCKCGGSWIGDEDETCNDCKRKGCTESEPICQECGNTPSQGACFYCKMD